MKKKVNKLVLRYTDSFKICSKKLINIKINKFKQKLIDAPKS